MTTRHHSPSDAVLVVDDETGVRELMSRWLLARGYSVLCAAGADEAIGLMRRTLPAVVLCDIRMPGRDGLWLAERIRHQFPETAIIMATGVHDVGAAVAGLRHGVVDYLTKPFGRDRLQDAVARGLEWHRTATDARAWREQLEREADAAQAGIATLIARHPVATDDDVDGLLTRITAGDPDLRAHGQRVAALAASIARAMGLTGSTLTSIRHAAMLHDLGKLTVPDAILRKPAPLTGDEQAIVRRQARAGAELLASIPMLADAAAIVRASQDRHHEPGADHGPPTIEMGRCIVAAADAYDTMTHPRVYRVALSSPDALLELDRCSGTQFDPHVVQVLKQLVGH